MCLAEGLVALQWVLSHPDVEASIRREAQAGASLGLPADYVWLAQPGCSLSPRWETWALQTFLELKYAEVWKPEWRRNISTES